MTGPSSDPPTDLVMPVRVDQDGVSGPTRGQARSRAWRSPARGWHVPAQAALTCEQRILEASVLAPEVGGVTGWAALRVHGAGWFTGSSSLGAALPVPLQVGPDFARGHPHVVLIRERLAREETALLHGVRSVTSARAVFDQMRYAADVREAVVAADMALAAEIVDLATVSARVSG